ncbi:MAG: hypothetical protein ACM34I_09130, partial [bacterium]
EIVGDKVYIAAKTGMVIVSLGRLGTAQFGTDGNGDGWADDVLSYTGTIGTATDLALIENKIYVSDGDFNYGIAAFDISNPVTPYYLGKIRTPDAARDLIITGRYLFLAGGNSGLDIFYLY